MSTVLVRSVATGRARFTVPGLRDRPGCAGLVDDRLTGLSGFRALRISPRTGSVVIWMEPAALDVDALVDALEEASPPSAPAKATRSTPDSSTGEVARLVVGGAVLAVVALRRLLARPRVGIGSSGLLGAITVFAGLPFFRGALRTLRGRSSPGTDTLVTAATVISLILPENVVALTVLWLLNIGEFLQNRTLRRTRRAIEDLLTIGEERVWPVREDGVEVEVALEELEPGDTVAVLTRPGPRGSSRNPSYHCVTPVRLDGRVVWSGVDLDVRAGEFGSLLGPTGRWSANPPSPRSSTVCSSLPLGRHGCWGDGPGGPTMTSVVCRSGVASMPRCDSAVSTSSGSAGTAIAGVCRCRERHGSPPWAVRPANVSTRSSTWSAPRPMRSGRSASARAVSSSGSSLRKH
ncbi:MULTISPECIES: hypothetical protein [Streptomyces]|uniref:hypothetical protein n=1 Tax=Streptomyces TaxID=1883 RepID=UPI0031D62821